MNIKLFYSLLIFLLGFFHFPFSGGGSYPTLPNGLHRKKRHVVKKIPLILPCISIASIAYSEQVGVNLQLLPKWGEIYFLYPFNNLIKIHFILIPP